MIRKVFALILAFSTVAFCQDKPRHIDFTQVLTGVDKKPIINGDATSKAVLTLGDAAVYALETMIADDRNLSGADKFKFDTLARKIDHNKDAELTIEEIATIKDRIGKVYWPIVVGAAWRVLDPAQK